MSLAKYTEKRNFKETTEPTGGKGKGKKLAFVVQRHHASHLHYDFRLELDGVLKSWAVPKGPSLNPKDKRLAMMVEDHPYDYKSFEGIIPKGNYGAGVVHIFDEGTYEAIDDKKDSLQQGLQSGNLKIVLHGKILRGEFALVRMKDSEQNAWLLIKHRDKYAVDRKYSAEDEVTAKVKKLGKDFKKEIAELPKPVKPELKKEDYKPMLAKLVKHVMDNDDWIFEEKLDGYRGIAVVKNGKASLTSRNGKNLGDDYPTVLKALANLAIDAVLDGEIVVREKDRTNFQTLQNYGSTKKKPSLKYAIFDVLEINGADVREIPLLQRKQLLATLLSKHQQKEIEMVNAASMKGEVLLKQAAQKGWEGIMAKKVDSIYSSGMRSANWQKIKLQQGQEAIIVGYTKPAGERNYFGALVLAVQAAKGKLTYIGNCGTGFTEQSLKEIFTLLKSLVTKDKPLAEKVAQERNVTWVKPKVVCEVTFSEWTENQHLRHPVFKGIRDDKKPKDIKLEIPASKNTKETPEEQTIKFGRKTVKLTNQHKLYWPEEKITKGEMVRYYQEIAPHILPHLKDRPLSLNRHPNGIKQAGFFQKDLNTEQIPGWVKYASLTSEHLKKEIDYLICNDEATLLWMANLGCIEINPWISTYRKPDAPLFAVLDLDPHGVDFKDAVKVALTAKEILDQLNITSFVKTSGSKGIHIVVPLHGYDYEVSKNFTHYIAGLVYEQHPDLTSLERSPSKRKNKIYLDYLQNRKGQTIVAPYSLRPKPGATVSTPLNWDEVNEDLSIIDFTIFSLKERLNKIGDLWKDIYKVKNKIKLG
ncbi:DNA ligase D [Pedobacter xixiisoli]|uniref:DNA ligase (ATP) n=1 Tax=Pedobacter xixiisoli TaxID=1476464 RepID=A0A286AAI7_9SPHI|nr:DNA ligase D [Pedobacter xixiisoli]SOD18925.1 bifunctional non-homologous end joining protein LigD [Pedobacter xixiisoli]